MFGFPAAFFKFRAVVKLAKASDFQDGKTFKDLSFRCCRAYSFELDEDGPAEKLQKKKTNCKFRDIQKTIYVIR